jgi:hypothetical protein
VRVYLLGDFPYVEADGPKHLLITYAVPQGDPEEFSCHNCQVLLGLATFANIGKEWRLEARDLQFGLYGEFGMPPRISLQPIGPERCGLQLLERSGGQGWMTQELKIILPLKGTFKAVFSDQVLYTCGIDLNDPQGGHAKNCVDYDSSLTLVRGTDKGEYYDLFVTKRSYLPAVNTIDKRSGRLARKLYRFNGITFTAVN